MVVGKHESIVKDTNNFLVKNGKSDYKILIIQTPSDLEKEAANELVLFLKKATGVELEIINDQETDCCGKYLSVGKNALWEKLFAGDVGTDAREIRLPHGCVVAAAPCDDGRQRRPPYS